MDAITVALYGAIITGVFGLLSGIVFLYLREIQQDKREETQTGIEAREAATKVRTEVESNRDKRIGLDKQLASMGLLPQDAHEQLRADAWDEDRGRLFKLMPGEDFERLEAYYRALKEFAEALRDYNQRLSKTDIPRLHENLRRRSEGLEEAERVALDATSKHLRDR